MKSFSWDNKYIGLLSGIFFTAAGFVLFGLFLMIYKDISFSFYLNELFLKRNLFKLNIITISIIFNVLPFYIAMKKNYSEFAKGLMAVLILGVIAGVIYYE